MIRVVDAYFRALRFFIAACLVVMVVLVFGNVVLRYGFNSGITVSEELSRWVFVWLTFVGALVALRDHKHLGMDSVVSKLPPAGKKACFLLSNLLMLGCVVVFAIGSWQQTIINIGNAAPATGLSSGWFYGVGLFFCATAAPLLVRNLYQAATGQLAEQDLIQVQESEDKVEIEKVAADEAAMLQSAKTRERP